MRRASAFAVAVVAALAVCAAAPAQADDDLSSGSWYFEAGHVQDAYDAGFRGDGVTVAVIDSQINPDITGLRGADLEVDETSFCRTPEGAEIPVVSTDPDVAYHGTGVVSMIVGTGETEPGQLPLRGVAPDAKVLYYNGVAGIAAESEAGELKCYDETGEDRGMDGVGRAIDEAVRDGADIISISIGGGISGVVIEALARAYAAGVVVVTGLPNDHGGVDAPSSSNGVVAVQAFDENVEIQKGDNGVEGGLLTPNNSQSVVIGAPGLGILQPGVDPEWHEQRLASGTSLAAPIVAGFLAVTKSKFPEATGNQLIQTMLHNTNVEKRSELEWSDDFGYGAISLTSMLADDPLSYPDENPLFDNPQFEFNATIGPTAEDVRAAAEERAKETPSASPTTEAAEPTDAQNIGAPWWPWVAGGGLVVVLGVAIAVIVMNGRSRHRRAAAETPAGRETIGGNDE